MESFQCLLFRQDDQKRIEIKQEAYSGIGAALQADIWLRMELTRSELKTVSQLAFEGYLTSVCKLNIEHTDVTDIIPSDQVKKLASVVTEEVRINNLTPIGQLDSILANVKCKKLILMNMMISEADTNTKSLVTAMSDRVEEVDLWGGVTLDIEKLTKYDGQGCCRKLRVYSFERSMVMLRHKVRLAKVVDTRRR